MSRCHRWLNDKTVDWTNLCVDSKTHIKTYASVGVSLNKKWIKQEFIDKKS